MFTLWLFKKKFIDPQTTFINFWKKKEYFIKN